MMTSYARVTLVGGKSWYGVICNQMHVCGVVWFDREWRGVNNVVR